MAPVDYLDIARRGIKSVCLRLSPKVLRDHRAIDTLYWHQKKIAVEGEKSSEPKRMQF